MPVIRKATRADVPAILALVKELAAYEREPDAVIATEADFLRDGFGESPAFHVLVATEEADVIGFAFYFFSYSTWVGRKCLYLEDLFVQPAHRGRGAGIALMAALAQEAITQECRRFVWQVLDWNDPAIAFYERLGAKVLREWLTVRLEGDALASLAKRC
ncbi:MAG: Histone acetyltransferase [Myxococcaceae bacterium]|nr:Histone acetyltransferase [Myxococcaceae bacterium]